MVQKYWNKVKKMLKEEVALNKFGNLNEISDYACFLLSPLTSFATGAIYKLDGGQTKS